MPVLVIINWTRNNIQSTNNGLIISNNTLVSILVVILIILKIVGFINNDIIDKIIKNINKLLIINVEIWTNRVVIQ